MAESIVQGLFGLNPNQIRQQQQAEERTRAIEFAQLSPFERANMGMYQAGSQIAGVGMGMLGMQNPAMQAAKQSEDVQKQIDHSTPEGLMQGAQIFNQAGNPQMAYRYQQAAQAKQKELADIARIRAQEDLAIAQAEKARKDQQFQPRGTQKAVEGVPNMPGYVREVFFDPNTKEVVYQGAPYKQSSAISAESKADAADRKSSAKLSTDLPQAKLRTDTMIQNIDDLYSRLVELEKDPGLSGITGTLYGRTPSARQSSVDAQAKLETIKAKVFVTALQSMREASKTGGAVGNVSDKEGDKLENTLTSLKQSQGTAEFQKELQKAQRQLELSKALIKRAFDEQFGDIQEDKKPTVSKSGPSMKKIGKTPDGRDVYQDSNGKKWVQ